MNEYAVEIKGLEKGFDQFNLGPLDLKIPKGTIVGYIGQNGAGKSTTIKLILGLLKPDNGDIKLLGQSVKNNSSLKDDIGIVFDDLFLPEELKLSDIERFCNRAYKNWDKSQFASYCANFNLPKNQIIKNYSRGMKMKLSIAIAMSHKAKLLLLDEATSGLDPVVREEILDILLDFMQDEDHTILISSHILSDLEKIADYIAFIDKGRLLFVESKDDLKDKYGVCSLSDNRLKELDKEAIIGIRKHAFGNDVLVNRNLVPADLTLERPSIEDIMIYFVKGDRL